MKDSVVWSSTSTEDWIADCDSKEDLIEQFLYTDDEEEYQELLSKDIEKIRDLAYDAYCDMCSFGDDFDYEDLKYNIIPMIEKQNTKDGYLWVIGNYQRWDGGREAMGVYESIEEGIESICYPDYDSRAELYIDENKDVYFTEYHHDAPTGGTAMKLYLLADSIEADMLADKLGNNYDWQYCSDMFEFVKPAIEQGILKPVKWEL